MHRINPQCVLTNTNPATTTLVSCLSEKPAQLLLDSLRSDPRPQALKPPRPTKRTPGCLPGETHIRMQLKSKLFYRRKGWPGVRERERACSRDLMLSSEAGMGERRVSFVYNQVRSLWLMLLPQEKESGPRQLTVMWEDTHIPVPGQSEKPNEE